MLLRTCEDPPSPCPCPLKKGNGTFPESRHGMCAHSTSPRHIHTTFASLYPLLPMTVRVSMQKDRSKERIRHCWSIRCKLTHRRRASVYLYLRCSDVRYTSVVKCFCSNRPVIFESTLALRKEVGMKVFVFKYCWSCRVCERRCPVESTTDWLTVFQWRMNLTYANERTAVVSSEFVVIKHPSLRPAEAKSWKANQQA